MGNRYGSIFITEDPDELNPVLAHTGWCWIKPSTGQVFTWNGSEWVEEDITINDVKLTGKVTTDGEKGLSGSKVIYGKRLTFTNGILTGFEDA